MRREASDEIILVIGLCATHLDEVRTKLVHSKQRSGWHVQQESHILLTNEMPVRGVVLQQGRTFGSERAAPCQALVFAHGEAIGHAGNVISHHAWLIGLGFCLILRRQKLRVSQECVEQFGDHPARLCRHPAYLIVAIKVVAQKCFKFLLLARERRTKSHQWRRILYIVNRLRRMRANIARGLLR